MNEHHVMNVDHMVKMLEMEVEHCKFMVSTWDHHHTIDREEERVRDTWASRLDASEFHLRIAHRIKASM